MDLVLVDGPNLFGTVGSFLEGAIPPAFRSELKAYMSDWFDFDRLVLRTLGEPNPPTLGIVLVHSNKQIGKSAHRVAGDAEATAFWGRQAANPGTSSLVVSFSKDEQEHFHFKCKQCQTPNDCPSVHEKGVDSTMIVYMFETVGSWNSLCLFSRDTDFVPAVWALRRRGKQVFVAAENADATTALGRASQSFFQVNTAFLLTDFGNYLAFRPDGVVDRWIAGLGQAAAGLHLGFWTDRAFALSFENEGFLAQLLALRTALNALPGLQNAAAKTPILVAPGLLIEQRCDRMADSIFDRWSGMVAVAKTHRDALRDAREDEERRDRT
jgi:hypothetical protein